MSDEHVLEVNGHKFNFTWRDVIQVGMVAAAIIGIYITVKGQTDANSRGIADLYKRSDIAQADREKMDREGTRRSHEIDAMQQQIIESHTVQLAEVNKKLGDMMPKVDKIDANVLWLMGKQLEARK